MQQALLSGLLEPELPASRIERVGARLDIPEATATIKFTHGLHRFPGKFIPQVPRYIFENHLPPTKSILDPFAGSGTTLLEAMLDGRRSIGCDIDPLSVLIVKGKVSPISTAQLLEANAVLSRVDWNGENAELIPDVPNFAHWFSEPAIQQLSSLKKACLKLNEPARTFALVLFSSVIRRVSNADDQTQKTYVSHTNKKTPPLPRDLFPVILRRGLDRMTEFNGAAQHLPRCEVLLHDSRASFAGMEFDHIVTSPPYIDSIDYVYNQMLEYFWLLPELGISSHEQFKALRKRPMGMVKTEVKLPDAISAKIPKFDEICVSIAEKSPKEAQAVKTFFRDYETHVSEISKVQKSGRIYASVVAGSLIRGQLVPTPEAVIALHESVGYELVDRFSYGIKRHYMKFPRRENSSKIIEDDVLIFKLCR
jgi:hypothetical protein